MLNLEDIDELQKAVISSNKAEILKLLYRAGEPMCVSDIAGISRIDNPVIYKFLKDPAILKYVEYVGEYKSGVGRPKGMYRLTELGKECAKFLSQRRRGESSGFLQEDRADNYPRKYNATGFLKDLPKNTLLK